MSIFLFGAAAIVGYAASAALIFRDAIKDSPHRTRLFLAWTAALMHGMYHYIHFSGGGRFNFGFFNISSLVSWIVVLLLLTASVNKPLEKLGVAIFPLAGALLLLDMAFPNEKHMVSIKNWEMGVHVLSSILAFSLLNLAALQAILLALQDQQLKSHHPKRLIRSLPPLQAMETLLFRMLALGMLFLSVSLMTGFVFIEDLFAQHLVHKTVLSIIAWFIFSGLLWGRLQYGWRGQTAIQLTLIGFVLLLLAYFGSKLVLELILHRV